MINSLKKAFTSKKGDSYIYLCVIVLVISMLVSVLILYMGLMAQVQIQKKDVQLKLDSCISEFAVDAHDAIKQGDKYAVAVKLGTLQTNAYKKLGFANHENKIEYENGNCVMYHPSIEVLVGNGYGLKATYYVSFPVVWGGKTYTNLNVPITVTSYYKTK